MTVSVISLTNPGAETGNTTGWTNRSGGAITANASNQHSGAYSFGNGGSGTPAYWDQEIAVDAGIEAEIDADQAAVRANAWLVATGIFGASGDSGALYLEFYDGASALISRTEHSLQSPTGYVQQSLSYPIPALTRFIRIGTHNVRNVGSGLEVAWDDFYMEISDNHFTDWPGEYSLRVSQEAAYALGTYPTAAINTLQMPSMVVAASEGASGLFQMKVHQIATYALVRGYRDRRDLRAWTFTQDDHDFYVLQLGDDGTIVYDKLSNQWAEWVSPGREYWRGNDGVSWEGMNISCDTTTGILWEIDPINRLDYGDTPIRSVVTGLTQSKMRRNAPCYMAELSVSEGAPALAGVGITLRTSDDAGASYINHGEIATEGLGENTTVRWYSLGLMPAPGRVFELIDTGYARRIDALDIEVGG